MLACPRRIFLFIHFLNVVAGVWIPETVLGSTEPTCMASFASTLALGYDGAVDVYTWSGSWSLSQALSSTASTAGYDGFGLSVSLSSLTLAVGAPYTLQGTVTAAGAVHVHTRACASGCVFGLEAILGPPSSSPLSPFDSYGLSVCVVSDNILAVGARVSGGRLGGGVVYLYTRVTTVTSDLTSRPVWALTQVLTPDPVMLQSFFGSSLAGSSLGASSAILTVGSPYYQLDYVPIPSISSASAGAAVVYVLVDLFHDFSAYNAGDTAGSMNGGWGSLWATSTNAAVYPAGSIVGTCSLTTPALVFNASGETAINQANTVLLDMPFGGEVTLSVQYCSRVSPIFDRPALLLLFGADGSLVNDMYSFYPPLFDVQPTSVSIKIPAYATPVSLSIRHEGLSRDFIITSISITRTGYPSTGQLFSPIVALDASGMVPTSTGYSVYAQAQGSRVKITVDATSGLPVIAVGGITLVANTSTVSSVASVWQMSSDRSMASPFLSTSLQGSVGTQSPLFDIGLSPTLAMFSIGYESALQAVTGNGRVNSFGQVEVFSISSSGGFFQLSHVEDIDANPSTLQFGALITIPQCFIAPTTRTSYQQLAVAAWDGVHTYSCLTSCSLSGCQQPDVGVVIIPQYLLLLEGLSAVCTISLLTAPLLGVSVVVSPSIHSVSPAIGYPNITLSTPAVFTTSNWSSSASITVSVPSYPTFIGDFLFTLTNDVSAPGDSLYDTLSAANLLVQFVDTKSPSPSPTLSPTVSDSMTGTKSNSFTATVTASGSVSPSRTASGSATPTRSSTASSTPSRSVSGTRSVTSSLTVTRSDSRSSSPTHTVSSTLSATVTSTVTGSFTRTQSHTPSAGSSQSKTPTVTLTQSGTPTGTRSSTVTLTVTRSVTVTRGHTTSRSAGSTPSSTPSDSCSETPTVTSSLTESGTVSESASVTPTKGLVGVVVLPTGAVAGIAAGGGLIVILCLLCCGLLLCRRYCGRSPTTHSTLFNLQAYLALRLELDRTELMQAQLPTTNPAVQPILSEIQSVSVEARSGMPHPPPDQLHAAEAQFTASVPHLDALQRQLDSHSDDVAVARRLLLNLQRAVADAGVLGILRGSTGGHASSTVRPLPLVDPSDTLNGAPAMPGLRSHTCAVLGSRQCEHCGLHLPATENGRQMHGMLTCPHRIVICPNCNESVEAAALTKHMEESCHTRRFGGKRAKRERCPQCNGSFVPALLTDHMTDTCPRRLVPCVYGCGGNIPAADVDAHVASGACLPMLYSCYMCNSGPLYTRFELADHQIECGGPITMPARVPSASSHVAIAVASPSKPIARDPTDDSDYDENDAFSLYRRPRAQTDHNEPLRAMPAELPPLLTPATVKLPAAEASSLASTPGSVGSEPGRKSLGAPKLDKHAEQDFVRHMAKDAHKRKVAAAKVIGRAVLRNHLRISGARLLSRMRLEAQATRAKESRERMLMTAEEDAERRRLRIVIDREQEKCAREMELMWIEDVSERRRLRGGREAAAMHRINAWAFTCLHHMRARKRLQCFRSENEAARVIGNAYRKHVAVSAARRELNALRFKRDTKAANTIRRAYLSWRARQSKLDRLHRVLSVQQSTIADLKGALASATQDNAAISAEIESLRASFANQTEDLKALHSQLTFANAQIDSYRSLANKRLTSMQFAFGIADDLQLQREEAWLLAEANAREISNLNAGIAEERDHIRDLEREMGAMNQAVLRASEYIKRLQQSGARANADISATAQLAATSNELEAARIEAAEAVRRAEELQEDLIILQNAKDTLEKQLAARGHIAARVSAGEDDLEEALRLVAKPVDSTQLCSLGCGRLLPLERVSVHESSQCPLRRVQCPSCSTHMSAQELMFHSVACGKCDLCGKRCQDAREKETHKLQECPNRLVSCPECDMLATYGGIPQRYMNDHTSMFCGGKKLSCYGCGAEVQLKNVARHVHEECEVLKGFTKPGIDWGKASVGNREPMTNYSRPGSPRLRVVESTFESEDIYRGSIGRRQSKDEPADFYPIATVKSVNRRSGSYGAAGGLSYGPDALRRSTASLSVEPTSDGSRRSYADPQSGVGSVLHGSKSEATATPSPPKSFNVVRSSSNPRGSLLEAPTLSILEDHATVSPSARSSARPSAVKSALDTTPTSSPTGGGATVSPGGPVSVSRRSNGKPPTAAALRQRIPTTVSRNFLELMSLIPDGDGPGTPPSAALPSSSSSAWAGGAHGGRSVGRAGVRAEGDRVQRTGLRGAGEVMGIGRTFHVTVEPPPKH